MTSKKGMGKLFVVSMASITIPILSIVLLFIVIISIPAFAQTTPITNLTYTTTSNSLTLSWIAIPGADEYGYVVGLYGSGIAEGTLTGTTVTISHLTPNTTYLVQVSAHSDSWGGWGTNNNLNITTQNLISTAVTPEFGPITALVLAIAVVFIIAVSTKMGQNFTQNHY